MKIMVTIGKTVQEKAYEPYHCEVSMEKENIQENRVEEETEALSLIVEKCVMKRIDMHMKEDESCLRRKPSRLTRFARSEDD